MNTIRHAPPHETAAWDSIYAEVGPQLLRYARRLTRDGQEADDILQETFLRAIRSKPDLQHIANVRSWLYRIATNEIIDRARRRRRLAFVPFRGLGVEAPAPETGEAELVRLALRSIPIDQATVLILRLHEGRSRGEIAEYVGISEEGVKSRLVRGRLNFTAAYQRLERGLRA